MLNENNRLLSPEDAAREAGVPLPAVQRAMRARRVATLMTAEGLRIPGAELSALRAASYSVRSRVAVAMSVFSLVGTMLVIASRNVRADAGSDWNGEVSDRWVYRGRLEAADGGAPFSGFATLKLTVFDDPTGPNELFTQDFQGVPISVGDFAVELGHPVANPFPRVVAARPAQMYVSAQVFSTATRVFEPFQGRQRVTSVPYAMRSQGQVLGFTRSNLSGSSCIGLAGGVWTELPLSVTIPFSNAPRLAVNYSVPITYAGASNGAIQTIVAPRGLSSNIVDVFLGIEAWQPRFSGESVFTPAANGVVTMGHGYSSVSGSDGSLAVYVRRESGSLSAQVCPQASSANGEGFLEVTGYGR